MFANNEKSFVGSFLKSGMTDEYSSTKFLFSLSVIEESNLITFGHSFILVKNVTKG